MFAARGIAVSLSVFVMVYCILSLAVCLAWRAVWLHSRQNPIRRIADLLFALRMLPLAAAAVITAAFTVPSFLLLEPRAIDEPLGGIPLVMGICGAMLGMFGVANASMALRRASRTISAWTSVAQPVASCAQIPVLRISQVFPATIIPPMTAAGIFHPKVLLSGAAESMLTTNELQTALNHEIAHVRRRDNVKKLLLRFVTFPGMSGLEAAWLDATEMAADDAAVSSAGEALDLAAALIKLSRLGPVELGPVEPGSIEPATDLTAALVRSPASVINARIERLIAWSADRLVLPHRFSPWYGRGAALVTVAVFAVSYSRLLVHVHTATEWLVR
jgi:Zn-dependent protease with chaperone function